MELSDKVSQLTVGMAADSPWISNHTQVSSLRKINSIKFLKFCISHAETAYVLQRMLFLTSSAVYQRCTQPLPRETSPT